jgi:Flp pilus assembly pilin Flp
MQLWVVMNMEAMVRIRAYLQEFWCTEEAQDLIEYTIIVAVFVLASVSVIGIFMPSVKAIWSTNDSELANASSFATS